MTTAYLNVADDAQCQCEHCKGRYDGRDLDPINEVESRVIAGKPVPAGQCPSCGALAYTITDVSQTVMGPLLSLRAILGTDRINANDIYAARDLVDEAIEKARLS